MENPFETIAADFLAALETEIQRNSTLHLRATSVSIRRSNLTRRPLMNVRVSGNVLIGFDEHYAAFDARRETRNRTR